MKWITIAFALSLTTAAAPEARKFPTPHHEKLNALVGEWVVAVKLKAGDEYREITTAKCEANWELDGFVLVQTYTAKLGERDVTMVQRLGYDSGQKKGYEISLDNINPKLVHNEGEFAADGKTLTHTGTHFDPETGDSKNLKTVYTFTDADHFTLDWIFGDGDKAEKAVILEHAAEEVKINHDPHLRKICLQWPETHTR